MKLIAIVSVLAAVLLPCVVSAVTAPEEGILLADGWTVNGSPVAVPHTWNAEDGANGPAANCPKGEVDSVRGHGYRRQSLVYRHDLPAPKPGKRYFVRCEGASINARVVVNGWVAARHANAFTAFTCEITDLLLASDNVLEIAVDNFYDEDSLPRSADYTAFGGLYRPVRLIETDAVCFDRVTPRAGFGILIAADASSGKVKVTPFVSTGKTNLPWRIDYSVAETGTRSESAEFAVPGHRLWSPESPTLYHLTARLVSEVGTDEITLPFGFRTTELRKDGYYLNGAKLKLYGVNFHQELKGRGWALSRADEDQLFGFVREIGCNAVRTAHYPQSQHIYDLCDESGVLAWAELPVTDLVGSSEAWRANARICAEEMVAQLSHHPGIAMWSISNEVRLKWAKGGETETLTTLGELERLVRECDPSRPTVQANFMDAQTNLNALAQGFGYNVYPGWYGGRSEDMKERLDAFFKANPTLQSIAVSEYGAGAALSQHQNPAPERCLKSAGKWHPEEYQTRHHAVQYPVLRDDPRLWGSFVWVLFDFAADARHEGDTDGINDKGLVSQDHRTRKDAFYFYKANWNREPMLHLCGTRMTSTTNETIEVTAFANCGPVSLAVNGTDVGIREPDSVKRFFWPSVRLNPGVNEITAKADRFTRTWRLTRLP